MYIIKNILAITLFLSTLSATWFKDIPRILSQPDGSTVECLISGDQYVRRLHDDDNFTIVHNPDDGFFYYADLNAEGNLVPTNNRVGSINPNEVNIERGLHLSHDAYLDRKEFYGHGSSSRPSRDAPSTGEIAQINVFIRFADDPDFPSPRSYYDAVFQTDADEPSLKHYFLDISHDSLLVNTFHYPGTFTGTNTAYVDLNNRAYYQPYSASNIEGYNGDTDRATREHTLLANALNSISTNISPLIDVDANDDGFVDAVSFVVYGEPGGWSDLLWPHRWSMYSQSVTINGSLVNDYLFMLSESWYFNVGVLCHEFGHVLGAPDYYHYAGDGAPTPVGGWDVMASNGNPPQFPSAFTQWKYFDWGDIPEITQSGTYTLNSLHEQTNNAFKIASPNSETEYFVVEYRKQEGMYDQNAPGSRDGLVIYRINPNAGNGNAGGPPDELYVYRPGGTVNNDGNFDQAPFSADYGFTEFNDNTDPSCYLYNDGNPIDGGLNIYNITGSEETISFSISFGLPELSVNPESLNFDLGVGDSQSQSIQIANSGDLETVLSYEVEIAGAAPFDSPLAGPDGGGYFWTTLSEEQPGTESDWIDISEIGTQLPLYHNDQFADQAIDLPFLFPFYDESYNYVQVNANGWIGWQSSNETVWLNEEVPSATLPRPAIFGFFDDLNPQNSNGNTNSAGDVYYHVNNDRAVIWFNDVVRWNTTDSGQFDFQIILHSDGAFDINYRDMTGTLNSGTVGFQNAQGTEGTQVVANQNFITNNMTLMANSTQSDIPWAILTSEANDLFGELTGGETVDLNLQVLTNNLGQGSYEASVSITSLEAVPVSVPVYLIVSDGFAVPELPVIDINESNNGIVDLPENTESIFLDVASRYTHVNVPNGDVIQILIQDDFTDEQILHVRHVLESYLVNIPGSEWGNEKGAVANSIATNNAILFLLNNENEYENPDLQLLFDSGIKGQDLLSTEVFFEGSPQYMLSSNRDATYEEVLHFIHGYGIQLAMPWMQSVIIDAMNLAMENGDYNPLNDLPVEDFDEEYLAMGLECYFGLWAHDPSGTGFCGDNEYAFITREAMENGDPALYNIIKGFFGENWLYTPILPEIYVGDFVMALDSNKVYTFKSQYLQNLLLAGSMNVNVYGNNFDNTLIGNEAINHFSGQMGDDLIIGSGDIDRSIYIGPRDEYVILSPDETGDSFYQIIDLIPSRDGIDNLIDIEEVEFASTVYLLDQLLSSDTELLPQDFMLYSPYPNPFNPVTHFKFDIPNLDAVNISVFDLSGKLTRTITNEEYRQGRYSLTWNGRNSQGKIVPTGIYFIQLTTSSFVQTKKALFLK